MKARSAAQPERYTSGGAVSVGRYEVVRANTDDVRLLAVFRDDAVEVEQGPRMVNTRITVPGRHVADRLDQFGIDTVTAEMAFDALLRDRIAALISPPQDPWEALLPPELRLEPLRSPEPVRREERNALAGLDVRSWIERTRAAALTATPELDRILVGPEPDNFWWLWGIAFGSVYGIPDVLARLRLALVVFPDEPVTFKFGAPVGAAAIPAPSSARQLLQDLSAVFAPTIVLTEGSTDAEFLSAGLALHYPHLQDLVRFMDSRSKPQGSAGALATTVKAFAAAGVANRIVAVFDNDAAATDALKQLSIAHIPSNIKVLQYPPLPVPETWRAHLPARSTSAGTPPGRAAPHMAGCVEMYLGTDIIKNDDHAGLCMSITSHHQDNAMFEGHFDREQKTTVQRRFRKKVRSAIDSGAPMPDQDWSGVQTILRKIITAHHDPGQTDEVKGTLRSNR